MATLSTLAEVEIILLPLILTRQYCVTDPLGEISSIGLLTFSIIPRHKVSGLNISNWTLCPSLFLSA